MRKLYENLHIFHKIIVFGLAGYFCPRLLSLLSLLLGHAADIIEENYGYGLAILGEGCLESFHKLFKRFRDRLSRKTNVKDNLRDVFSRLYLHSSPFIRSKRPKREKNLKVDIFEERHTFLPILPFVSERAKVQVF